MFIINWFKKLLEDRKERKLIFPIDDQIEYQKLEKWQNWFLIDDNIEYWKEKHGREISKLQSGWELGYYKVKEEGVI